MADTLTIRDLRGDDIFPILHIIGQLDLADRLVGEFAAGEVEGETQRARGIRIGGTIAAAVLKNIGKVRDDVNKLLASLTGSTVAEVKGLGLGAYVGLVTALVKRPEFVEVFTSAANLGAAESADS